MSLRGSLTDSPARNPQRQNTQTRSCIIRTARRRHDLESVGCVHHRVTPEPSHIGMHLCATFAMIARQQMLCCANGGITERSYRSYDTRRNTPSARTEKGRLDRKPDKKLVTWLSSTGAEMNRRPDLMPCSITDGEQHPDNRAIDDEEFTDTLTDIARTNISEFGYCPTCEHGIYTQAETCPHCGDDLNRLRD